MNKHRSNKLTLLEPSARAGSSARAWQPQRSSAFRRATPRPCSSSTSPRATSSRCRSRFRISSARRPATPTAAPQRHPDHHRQPAALRPVRADRSGRLHRADRRPSTRCPALPTGGRSMRRRWSPAASRARATARLQGRVPAVGRVRRPAAAWPAVHHHARQLAAHRAHHLRRDLRAPHRREGLFRHAASSSSTRPGRRTGASSGSRSWTRTAPTCAISRAATISC